MAVFDRQAELERIASERLAAERAIERTARRELVRSCLELVGSCVLGLFIMGFAFYVTDYQLGQIFLLGGMVVGYAGMAISPFTAYRRGEERGDW
jgi:hypothetical protein